MKNPIKCHFCGATEDQSTTSMDGGYECFHHPMQVITTFKQSKGVTEFIGVFFGFDYNDSHFTISLDLPSNKTGIYCFDENNSRSSLRFRAPQLPPRMSKTNFLSI